jgi:hypothetical protein
LNSPKRIAVAVLFTLAGLGAQVFLGVEVGLAAGLVVGLVAANLVPSDKACPIGRAEAGEKEHAEA